jgi:hypothetical protein
VRQPRYKKPKVAPPPAQPGDGDGTKVLRRTKTRATPDVPLTLAQQRLAEAVKFTMVLEPAVATRIDELRQTPARISRRHWIRLAIAEKIERDS